MCNNMLIWNNLDFSVWSVAVSAIHCVFIVYVLCWKVLWLMFFPVLDTTQSIWNSPEKKRIEVLLNKLERLSDVSEEVPFEWKSFVSGDIVSVHVMGQKTTALSTKGEGFFFRVAFRCCSLLIGW